MKVVQSELVDEGGNSQNTKITLDIKGYRPNYVEDKIFELRPNCISVEIDTVKKRLTAVFKGVESDLNLRNLLVEALRTPTPPAL